MLHRILPILIVSVSAPAIAADLPAPIEVQGPALPNCEPTQTIEARYLLSRMVPHDRTKSGFGNRKEPLCEFVMKLTLKADGSACSQIPPGDRGCKFKLDGKESEFFPSFRYQYFTEGKNVSDHYQLNGSPPTAILYVDATTTSKSPVKVRDSVGMSLAASEMPSQIHLNRAFIPSSLDAGDKNKREGLVGEIMIEKKPMAK